MRIIIKGMYFKRAKEWVAEIPSLDMKVSQSHPCEAFEQLKKRIEKDIKLPDLILLIEDKGVLLLILPDNSKSYEFIANNLVTDLLSNIRIDDPFKEIK